MAYPQSDQSQEAPGESLPAQAIEVTGEETAEIDSRPSRGLFSRVRNAISDQARIELATNIRATESLERLWLIARFAIALTVLAATYSAWGSEGPGEFIYVASGLALVGNIAMFMLLRRGKAGTVFVSGFIMDNIAIFTAWTGSVWLLRGSLGSNDIYLALFPILTLWTARLGFIFGTPYIMLWLVWIGWSLNHFFHPLSYEVEQMPLRVIFLGLAAIVGMWITHALREQIVEVERTAERTRSLQELADAKNEFISSVSHELRTPLTVILGFTEVLERGLADTMTDRQKAQLQAIGRNGTHLNRLISDLLDLTRLEAGKMALTKDDFDLDQLLHEVTEGFELIFAEKKQSLSFESATENVWINGDSGRITQVLMNLLSNASKYSPPETTTTLRSSYADGSVQITVQDQGQGISEKDQQNLFTMFYRTNDAAASTTPGNGIGLYLCKRIVEFHGGEISIESQPGKGTAMTFTLPGASLRSRELPVAS